MHDESNHPRRTTVTVGEHEMTLAGTCVSLGGFALGDVERTVAKPPTWTATLDDGRTHTASTRRDALQWLLDATAEERAERDAAKAQRRADYDAEIAQRGVDDAQAADTVTQLVRTVRPDYRGPDDRSWAGVPMRPTFTFWAPDLRDILVELTRPAAVRTLPTWLAVEHLREHQVVLCHRGRELEDQLVPWDWGYLLDVQVYDDRDGWVHVEFVFEDDQADVPRDERWRSITVPLIGATAEVTADAVTMHDLDRPWGEPDDPDDKRPHPSLVAVIAEDVDDLAISGTSNIEVYSRSGFEELASTQSPMAEPVEDEPVEVTIVFKDGTTHTAAIGGDKPGAGDAGTPQPDDAATDDPAGNHPE